MIRATRILATILCVTAGLLATATAAEPSIIREESFPSPALGTPLHYWIYLPPDYEATKGPLPVGYLLHGAKGEGADWVHAGHIREVADEMIAAGQIAPMILVMPDAENSWYVNSRAEGGAGDYETAIGQDIAAWIESRYKASTLRSGRAIAGISMGGFGAFRLAMMHPDRYVAAASLSGAFWSQMTPEIAKNPRVERIFASAFPAPIDVEKFIRSEPQTLAAGLKGMPNPPAFYITFGRQDLGGVMTEGPKLYEQLREIGVPVRVTSGDGGHEWEFWGSALPGMLAFFSETFNRPAATVRSGG